MENKKERMLKITKKSGMIHYAPMSQEKTLVRVNKRQGSESYQVDEVELEYNEKREIVSETHKRLVSESEIITNKVKVADLQDENAKLKAELEALKNGAGKTGGAADGANEAKPFTVPEMTEKINACTTVDEVQLLIKEESRKGVLDAANKKITALSL